MITIATIIFYTTTVKKKSKLWEERNVSTTTYTNITLHMIPDTNFYIQRTTAQLQARPRQYSKLTEERKKKKRIKPLNWPKRKAAMNNQKLRPGKLSPNYATVWVAMGQREGTVFPFCSKFFFETFFVHILMYVICC